MSNQNRINKIYEDIEPIVNELVGNRQLSSDMILPIITHLIRAIQNFSLNQDAPLDGAVKQQIALNVLHLIIDDLRKNGKISDNVSESLILSLTVFGPSLIDFASAAVKKVFDVVKNIDSQSCQSCFGCRKK